MSEAQPWLKGISMIGVVGAVGVPGSYGGGCRPPDRATGDTIVFGASSRGHMQATMELAGEFT